MSRPGGMAEDPGPLVAIGELTIGILLILGLFTGIAAFLGVILNFSFVFAGSAGVNRR